MLNGKSWSMKMVLSEIPHCVRNDFAHQKREEKECGGFAAALLFLNPSLCECLSFRMERSEMRNLTGCTRDNLNCTPFDLKFGIKFGFDYLCFFIL